MPFRRNEEEERVLIQKLKEFAELHTPINILLSGFNCFPPKVLYVAVAAPELIIERYHVLRNFLQEELSFSLTELNQKFHPHVTLATRDLSERNFFAAWFDFKEREFEAAFLSSELSLLKHNGVHWDILHAFQWGV